MQIVLRVSSALIRSKYFSVLNIRTAIVQCLCYSTNSVFFKTGLQAYTAEDHHSTER